jgi:hypothetical protein
VTGLQAKGLSLPIFEYTFAPPTGIDSGPVLTVEILQRVATFWTAYTQMPDSIHERASGSVVWWIGARPWPVLFITIQKIAAYPAVTAALQQAKLTAQQMDDEIRAIENAWRTWHSIDAGPVTPTSVLGRNIALLRAHPKALATLKQSGLPLSE